MGSSSKKKSQKRADFQKPKLKVGKARPKPTNLTDTSFKAKSITLPNQSLTSAPPTLYAQFTHATSLLSSRNHAQRSDSLAHLTSTISSLPVSAPLPAPLGVIFPKISPLILDSSNSVRNQLLKLLHQLGKRGNKDVGDHMGKLLLYIRAGLTHLAAEIRGSSLDVLAWGVETAGLRVVGCPGGWVKTLRVLLLVLGWEVESSDSAVGAGKWTGKATVSIPGQKGNTAKTLTVLTAFLQAGLVAGSDTDEEGNGIERWPFPLRNTQAHMIPKQSNAFAPLNLFGAPRDEDGEMYEDLEDRRRIFVRKGFLAAVEKGVVSCRGEGGETGRAAGGVRKVVEEGMRGFEDED